MPLFWFLAGVLSALAAMVILLPWIRTMPRFGALPSVPWQAGAGAVLVLVAALALYRWIGHPELVAPSVSRPAAAVPAGSPESAMSSSRAGSMSSAIAGLEARLAKGNGTPDDWELLAKSFEFLGLPAEASEARAHRLPPLPMEAEAGPSSTPLDATAAPRASGAVVRGEVSLAAPLRSKAAPGVTLFIVAKSSASPGPPVAVFRSTTSEWPVKFTLDDSQSMLPGRNLSSAGRVTIEARISQSGQALPSRGDLVGTSGEITPGDGRPLAILIDHVVP